MPKRKYNGGAREGHGGGFQCHAETRPSTEKLLGDRVVVVDPSNRESCCWLVDGIADEYGMVRGKAAHRFVYRLLVGPIPKGNVVHHVCENPGCVNPRHLDASMTNAEHLAHHRSLKV